MKIPLHYMCDTLEAGAGLCDETVVRTIITKDRSESGTGRSWCALRRAGSFRHRDLILAVKAVTPSGEF